MVRKSLVLTLAVTALGLLGISQSAPAEDTPAAADCCPAAGCCKVCCPKVETKKVPKRVYGDECEDFCLPRASWICRLLGRNNCEEGDDPCLCCGKPRTKKYLLVKIRYKEECVKKCIVVEKECCPAPAPCNMTGMETPPACPASSPTAPAQAELIGVKQTGFLPAPQPMNKK